MDKHSHNNKPHSKIPANGGLSLLDEGSKRQDPTPFS